MDQATVFKEAEGKLKELRVLFAKLAPEVQGEDFWRCARGSLAATASWGREAG